MRVCLANPPTIVDFKGREQLAEEEGLRVPLGILTLASALEGIGQRPTVVDLDLTYESWRGATSGRGDFARYAADRLAREGAEVYGLGTICGSYPLTLRISSALREARPDARILLGGPQATASAEETLAAFPAVDVIVRGEGDVVLPLLVGALEASSDLAAIPGISYRTDRGPARTPDSPPIADLDALPAPAYHLYTGKRDRSLPLEAGRGCPFSCTFCSTSRFFGRTFRMKSPERLVGEMLDLRRRYGTRRFDLIHDNFTVDPRRVIAFCDAISATGAGLVWSCSSRTDTIDDDLVDRMWRAGCRGIFFGVESGSPDMQRAIRKRLDLGAARDRLRRVARRRIPSTVSFVTGFPDEREEDLRKTVSLFVETLRIDYLLPQLSLLSPLPGTPLEERHRDELVYDDVVSDMAHQGVEQEAADRELIRRHRDIFTSFYSVPTRWLDRHELYELRLFLLNGRYDLRWLLVAAADATGDAVEAFRAFRAWRSGGRGARTSRAVALYYASPRFRSDFIRFARDELARRHPVAAPALRALARFYARFRPELRRVGPRVPRSGRPVPAPHVHLTPLDRDGAALIRCLRRGGDLGDVPRRRGAFVTRWRRGHVHILCLGDEATDLLRLCDGRRSVRAIARAFRRLHPEVGGVPADVACAFGLERLRRSGLLSVA